MEFLAGSELCEEARERIEDRVSIEQKLRRDLSFAYRELARMGLHEGICNHLTTALPGNESFLVIRYGVHWLACQAEDLLVVDENGVVLSGEGTAEVTAVCIHAAIHRQIGYERATCVFHLHSPASTALTCVSGTSSKILPIHQNACRFLGGSEDTVSYDEHFNGLGNSRMEGDRIAKCIGNKARILFMGNHGVLAIGSSAAECLDDLYYLERVCQNQVAALSCVGGRVESLRYIEDKIVQQTFNDFEKERVSYAKAHFLALQSVEKSVSKS
eukprot:GSChrysophyteH1.ASY1.ANO1.2852.1 assembled CDS